MSIKKVLRKLKNTPQYKESISYVAKIPIQKARYSTIPSFINPKLKQILLKKNIKKLYIHQAKALDLLKSGQNIVVVTPTASGKSLCYNLPVLNSLCCNNKLRSLYLFPTKALAQDQMNFLSEWLNKLDGNLKAYTYDGDTPSLGRKKIRSEANIIITNPDMLHSGILPNHQKWQDFFKNLSYIVVDELHIYRGIFGSHVANVFRRLKRICDFYGSSPKIICTSATIANPAEHANNLTGHSVRIIDENGAPQGPKDIFFYNPPIVNKTLDIRRGSILESQKIAAMLIEEGIQTIIFAKSRLQTEVLAKRLREHFQHKSPNKSLIRSYRGGYLPEERRKIEKDLREGRIMGVVSTNALELGIDIGSIEAVVIAGYPGTIASTWQQIGRAGRNLSPAMAFIVASANPLDQFIVKNPDFLLNTGNEHALLNPDNYSILKDHIKCAAYELPFSEGENFGGTNLRTLFGKCDKEDLYRKDGLWHLADKNYPAYQVSLRHVSPNNFQVLDKNNRHSLIGTVDGLTAPSLIHTGAIYIHEGQQFLIDCLDYPSRKAYAHKVKVDYYTSATPLLDLTILETTNKESTEGLFHAHGEIVITSKIISYKKIKLSSHENIGWANLSLPEERIHTSSYWLSLPLLKNIPCSNTLLESILEGLANLLQNIVPLELMCDIRDIRVYASPFDSFTKAPTIYFYENNLGGIGFSNKLFLLHKHLLRKAFAVLKNCPCQFGCPLCIGPSPKPEKERKKYIHKILTDILKTIR